MTLAWYPTINPGRGRTIRKVYNTIGNDRELSPAAYPSKLIRQTPRNNAGHGREEGLARSSRVFFFFRNEPAPAMCYARPTFSGRVKVVLRIAFFSARRDGGRGRGGVHPFEILAGVGFRRASMDANPTNGILTWAKCACRLRGHPQSFCRFANPTFYSSDLKFASRESLRYRAFTSRRITRKRVYVLRDISTQKSPILRDSVGRSFERDGDCVGIDIYHRGVCRRHSFSVTNYARSSCNFYCSNARCSERSARPRTWAASCYRQPPFCSAHASI